MILTSRSLGLFASLSWDNSQGSSGGELYYMSVPVWSEFNQEGQKQHGLNLIIMLKRGDWISFPESFQTLSVGLSHHHTSTLPGVATETNNRSKSFLQRRFDTSARCHVYICTLHACPQPQWAYSAAAPRPLLPLWWELNCSGWKQLGAKSERAREWKESVCVCLHVCVCVLERHQAWPVSACGIN